MAPNNALVLTSTCPLCEKETITCRFWASWDHDSGAWEGDGDSERTCDCPADDRGYMWVPDGDDGITYFPISADDVCEQRWDQYIAEGDRATTGAK